MLKELTCFPVCQLASYLLDFGDLSPLHHFDLRRALELHQRSFVYQNSICKTGQFCAFNIRRGTVDFFFIFVAWYSLSWMNT